MKKRILAIVACGILVTVAVGFGTIENAEAKNNPEASEESDTDDLGREYVNEFDPDTNQVLDLYEIEFQIPGNWVEFMSDSDELGYNSDSDGGTLVVGGGPTKYENITSEEIQDEMIAIAEEGGPLTITGRELVTILDDVPAFYFTYTQNISGILMDGYAFAFFTEENFYTFLYDDRQDSGYNHSQEFGEIINSITWAPTETFYEVSFWLPKTWVETSTDEDQLIYKTAYGQFLITTQEGSYGTDLMGLEENQDAFMTSYEAQESFELSDRQTITILDDVAAFYFTCSYLISDEPMNIATVVFCTDDQIYSFMFGEYDSYDDSEIDDFYDVIDSISWANDERQNDFFSDSERQNEYKALYESYQLSELYDYVQEYISDAGEEISPDDSAYTILDLVEPLVEYEDTWTVTQDEFDSSYSVSFAGADTISESESIALVVKGSNVQVTLGFQKSDWLFFDKFGLSIDGEEVESHKIKSYDTNTTVVGGGIIEETYMANSLFKDASEQLKDAEKAIIRFENTSTAETYDHTLTDKEMNALYVGYLLRANYVELSNLLSEYQNNNTMD